MKVLVKTPCLLTILLMTSTPFGSVHQGAVRSVTSQLICVCGCSNMVVASCECGKAKQMTGEAQELLSSGLDTRAVLASFEEKYGAWVLAAPKAEGFNVMAWALPIIAMGFGVVVMVSVLRRLKPSTEKVSREASNLPLPADVECRHILEREIRS